MPRMISAGSPGMNQRTQKMITATHSSTITSAIRRFTMYLHIKVTSL